ncbi:MAG: glutamate racemase [Lachnospiraceae bacterium]|nr:glutamate racemase [Lachnospiraceae bacterium]
MTDIKKLSASAPIGVFDSGVGGLTVVNEIISQIPSERIVYFGDTARVPYGGKSKETITMYAEQIVRFLLEQGVKAIVVACNTASAYALDTLEKEIDIPIIGVVKPGAKTAAETTKNGRIGIIGTEGTVGSRIYEQYISRISPASHVVGKACPLFCPLVEEGLLDDPVTDEIARRYLEGMKGSGIDTLILGCTHYPLIRTTIERVMGKDVALVNPAWETAHALKDLLTEEGILNPEAGDADLKKHRFYVSDSAEKFGRFASTVLKYEGISAETVRIEEY